MATWGEFARVAPVLAAEGRRLFYQYGVGLGFLATVRADGGPRLHPMCPVIDEGGLYAFIVPSPKRDDLRRDGRYAMHAFTPEQVDDEFYVTGRARVVTDSVRRAALKAAYHAPVPDDHELFEFEIQQCMLAKYERRGQWPPAYTKWADGASS
ncbi:MAG: hypothetical protein E6J42_00845 [Chloroflexi bacterium]|nr:MAG: hypothetical protein E6J42_00845 [Chloroflexota bacterium]